MNSRASPTDMHQETWNRYRGNLPRHLMGITRHLQSEAMHTLTTVAGHSGLRHSFEPFITRVGDEGCRITDLAAWLGVSKQACNQTINQIERCGYVRREEDPNDGRARVLRLTPRGRTLVRDGAQAILAVQLQFRSILGERKLGEFVGLLDTLCRGLQLARPAHREVRQDGPDLLGALLPRISGHITHRLLELTSAKGHPRLKMSFGQVLGLIGPGGGSIRQIARIQQVSKQAVSAVVAELRRLGYVESAQDPRDARGQLVNFSAAGRQLLSDSVASVDALEREFARIIGDAGVQQLCALASELYDRLGIEAEVFRAPADLDLMARHIRQQLGPQGARELARLLHQPANEEWK